MGPAENWSTCLAEPCPDPVIARAQCHREVAPAMRSYSMNAKGNFRFDRVISGWRNRPVLDLRLKK